MTTGTLDVESTVRAFADLFASRGSPERARGEKAYLKSVLDFYGIDSAGLRAAAREFRRDHASLPASDVRSLVLRLWDSSYFDLRALGVVLLEQYATRLDASDIALVEDLLRRSHTWALVDFLSTKVAGSLVARFPEAKAILLRWSRDGDFWVRRASMLSLLPELRAGGGDFDTFAGFAASMIREKEFFIRKAIGWVLREVSKKRPHLVYDFLSRHLSDVSGLTVREGSKYLPAEQRAELMARSRRSRSLGSTQRT